MHGWRRRNYESNKIVRNISLRMGCVNDWTPLSCVNIISKRETQSSFIRVYKHFSMQWTLFVNFKYLRLIGILDYIKLGSARYSRPRNTQHRRYPLAKYLYWRSIDVVIYIAIISEVAQSTFSSWSFDCYCLLSLLSLAPRAAHHQNSHLCAVGAGMHAAYLWESVVS